MGPTTLSLFAVLGKKNIMCSMKWERFFLSFIWEKKRLSSVQGPTNKTRFDYPAWKCVTSPFSCQKSVQRLFSHKNVVFWLSAQLVRVVMFCCWRIWVFFIFYRLRSLIVRHFIYLFDEQHHFLNFSFLNTAGVGVDWVFPLASCIKPEMSVSDRTTGGQNFTSANACD